MQHQNALVTLCQTATMPVRGMTLPRECPACGVGVSSGLGIFSMLMTRTNFHVEDLLLGAYNILVFGAPKIW